MDFFPGALGDLFSPLTSVILWTLSRSEVDLNFLMGGDFNPGLSASLSDFISMDEDWEELLLPFLRLY